MVKVEVVVKAQFYDLDPTGVVWHGHYARFMEQARCELLDTIGYNYEEMRDSGYLWPIVDMHIKYVRPIEFSQEIRIVATLTEYKYRLRIAYEILTAMVARHLPRRRPYNWRCNKKPVNCASNLHRI